MNDDPNLVPIWSDKEWEEVMIVWMKSRGWENDQNNETTLGFSFKEGDHHWIRDYEKSTRRFIQYDGNQKITLMVSKK